MTGVGGSAAVDPLLMMRLREGGVPLRERLRYAILLGDCSNESLRGMLEAAVLASSVQSQQISTRRNSVCAAAVLPCCGAAVLWCSLLCGRERKKASLLTKPT
jgi:hypothetical protein